MFFILFVANFGLQPATLDSVKSPSYRHNNIINLEVFKQISRMISKFYSKFSASCNGVSLYTMPVDISSMSQVLGIQQHPLLDSSLFSIFTLGLFEELLPFIKSIPKLPALTPL